MIAKCMHCENTYKGSLKSTTNFLNHIKCKHDTMLQSYNEYKKCGAKRPRLCSTIGPATPPSADWSTISTSTPQSQLFAISYQKAADVLVTNLIVDAALPIRLVECAAFKDLVVKLSQMTREVHCPSTYTVNKCLEEQYERMLIEIRRKLATTRYVCTTADMWTSRCKSYLGVTVHWLNDKCVRESYAIACSRMMGTQDYKTISRIINHAHQRYGLTSENIVCTVTDNAANMVEFFKDLGIDSKISDKDEQMDIESTADDDNEYDIHEITDMLEAYTEIDEFDFKLPRNVRCASHTLNLIVTADIQKAIQDKLLTKQSFEYLYVRSMELCSQLWNNLKRSPKQCELFTSKFGKLIRLPCPRRWNSLYNSLSDLIELDAVKLDEYSQESGLTSLTSTQLSFLTEFVSCLAPVANSLDRLQGWTQISLSELIPCILQTQHHLSEIRGNGRQRYCNGLIDVILTSLRARFDFVVDWSENKSRSMPFVLATMTTPAWKMHWEPNATLRQLAIDWLVDEIRPDTLQHEIHPRSNSMQVDKSFYTFISFDNAAEVQESGPSMQVMQYMCDASCDIESLKKYPLVEQVFHKYNAGKIVVKCCLNCVNMFWNICLGIPSSEPVERLFSFAALDLTGFNYHNEAKFEKLTLLKANKK